MASDLVAGSQTATALYNAIQDETAGAVLPKLTQVVQIDASEKPIDAANLMWKNSLLAIPVFDEIQHKYIGFFDMRDILRAIINMQQQQDDGEETPTSSLHASSHHTQASIEEETEEELQEEEVIVQTLQDLSLHGDDGEKTTLASLASKRPAYCCRLDDSLQHVCTLLAQSDCRRVLVIPSNENDGRCSDMVSRSTLIKYLASHVSTSDLQETLDQAGFDYRKPVISLDENATAKQAFELILDKKLYSLAVVDEEGGLVGNTSARDIKLVALHPQSGRTNAFDLDILSFLAGVRQEDSVHAGKKAKYPACNVRESSTVGHVLSLLAKTGYHRVFVTNTYMEPVGVISELDILQFVLSKGKLQLSHDLPNLAE